MDDVPEIMVTIGPTLETPDDLLRAIEAGARWFRLPCGYRQRPHVQNAQTIRAAAEKSGVLVKLLLDLPSSRPRTGKMDDLPLARGARVKFYDPRLAQPAKDDGFVSVPLPGMNGLLAKVGVGHRLWFCDGRLEFVAEAVLGDGVVTSLRRGAIPLKSSNSIYLPDSPSPFTMITDEDIALLEGFAKAEIVPDWIALSMASSAEDVRVGRAAIRQRFGDRVRVMAKFETTVALAARDAIMAESDGIMVARGDLALALEFIRLPEAQDELVAAAHRAGKTVVVATQIIECYAESGVPQRSELSGLSVLARQRPDAVMLGKETVYSPRPIEAIRFTREVLTYEVARLAAARTRLPRSLVASKDRPLTVAIEGPNGVGKTLLCGLLRKRIGLRVLRGVPSGWEESPMKLRMIRDADWLASAMYFLSGVIESTREANGLDEEIVVVDRSIWSTLAVHYATDPDRLERIMPLLELAADRLRIPNLTIVLEASPQTCRRRIASKSADEQVFDAASPADEDFDRREREFYHWLSAQGPKVAFVDTEGRSAEDVYGCVAKLIQELR